MKNVEAIQKERTGFGTHYGDSVKKKDDKKDGKKSFIEMLKKRRGKK